MDFYCCCLGAKSRILFIEVFDVQFYVENDKLIEGRGFPVIFFYFF